MARISGKTTGEMRDKMPKAISEAMAEAGRVFWAEGRLEITLRELLRLKSAELVHCRH